jgi:cysteinyl-tRNA synthetase
MRPLKIYNTITRQKETFAPITPGHVGMYVCGPTVYNYVHLGNCRTFITFDVVYRYLKHLGYKVRYVRNITDVGHLEDEVAGTGEDRIGKKARLENLEPMEVVQHYSNAFHDIMDVLNLLRPSIEPQASGHIVEQIECVQQIINNGFAYEANGSVYFDVPKFIEATKDRKDLPNYGQLSGKITDDLLAGSRDLDGQDEKRSSLDFAIWKNPSPEHLMRWNSPWSNGIPGWHLECSVMSQKYLGDTFDIHGGGMDLKFPHHECEIAQSIGSCGKSPVNYWMHANMLTVDGAKMSKSVGNFIMPTELFAGNHPLLTQAYSPMTLRFSFLQAHYSSTLDLSNDALQAAEKGYKRLMNALNLLPKIAHPQTNNTNADAELTALCEQAYEHLSDDFNTAMLLADLFEMASKINIYYNKQAPIEQVSAAVWQQFTTVFSTFITDILGLKDETTGNSADNGITDGLMELVLHLRAEARTRKDWTTSDIIRDRLQNLKIQVKDGKEGSTWSLV